MKSLLDCWNKKLLQLKNQRIYKTINHLFSSLLRGQPGRLQLGRLQPSRLLCVSAKYWIGQSLIKCPGVHACLS